MANDLTIQLSHTKRLQRQVARWLRLGIHPTEQELRRAINAGCVLTLIQATPRLKKQPPRHFGK